MLSFDLLSELLDVSEDLDDLSLGLVYQHLDLMDVSGFRVHQILSDFLCHYSSWERFSNSFGKIAVHYTLFSAFPLTKSLKAFLDEDVASENPDDVVYVEKLEWPQGRAGDYFKIIVRPCQILEHVREHAGQVICHSITKCIADVIHETSLSNHARAWRAAEHEGEADGAHGGIERGVASLFFLVGV